MDTVYCLFHPYKWTHRLVVPVYSYLIKHCGSDRRIMKVGGVVGNLRAESIFQSNVFMCVLATVVGE